MVAFHDRRKTAVQSVDDVLDRVPMQPGDTVSKHMINERYLVRGEQTDHGREFVIHEVLPNGDVIERGREERRWRANTAAGTLTPTSTYDV